jgi:hypothetical protein
MELIVIAWFAMCLGAALLAESRGRSALGYFALSLLLSPILGLIIILLKTNLNEEAAAQAERIREEERRETERRREHERQLESLKVLAKAPLEPGNTSNKLQPTSLADELTKLAQLRDQGILTDEEFAHQKQVILSKSI